jgi:hypothetical protein
MGLVVARRRALAAATLIAILVSACGGSHNASPPRSSSPLTRPSPRVTSASTTAASTTTRPSVPVAPACHLPLTHDTYDGFHIAVPAGWDLSALQGRIEVKNASETEAVVVVPAVQTNALTPQAFFTSTLHAIAQQVRSTGGTFTVTGATTGSAPASTFDAVASGQRLAGKAGLTVLPLATPLSKSELAYTMYWAPASSLASAEPMLQSVAQCFGPERGTLFSVVKDPVFTYEIPPGWNVADETSDVIDLHHGNDAAVSYALVFPVPQTAGTPQSFIDYVLSRDNITGVTPLVRNGGGQSTEYEEFTGTLNGAKIHGLISGGLPNGVSGSGFVRLALADQPEWNSFTGAMVQMAGFIQHGFTQDLQSIQQVSRQWQNFSGQVANFDDTLNNQQLVQDPTNGKLYEAPYAAFGTGSQGPGYYVDNGLPGGQKLNEVERR